jgi:phosphopantetheinyl transferase
MRPEDCQEQIEAAKSLIKKLKKEKYQRIERFKRKEQEI